nr:probable LRR receptor-like serine/threonine-protein kinase At3g47570 [Ipomoea batatas]
MSHEKILSSLFYNYFSSLSSALCSLHHHLLFCLICTLTLSFVSSSSSATLYSNETDRIALLEFKHRISDDPNGVLLLNSWNDSVHHCRWKGVSCGHRHRRVVGLELPEMGLVGTISPHIGNLTFLRVLDLYRNMLHGEIPGEIGGLFRLRYLDLSTNALTGEVTKLNLSSCVHLRKLYFSQNGLQGNLPTAIQFLANLKKLQVLSMDTNRLTGGIPPTIGNLSSLRVLSLKANHLKGRIPHEITQCWDLNILSLSSNDFSGTLSPSFFNMTSIQIFSVTQNSLQGTIPNYIGDTMPNLVGFYFGGNKFYGTIPISFPNASKLQVLEVSGNHLVGKVPDNIGRLKDLLILHLWHNLLGSNDPLNDLAFITSLSNCSNLNRFAIDENRFEATIDLENNNFDGNLPSNVENFRNLNEWYMNNNKLDGTIPQQVFNLPSLSKYLDISHNSFTGPLSLAVGKLKTINALDISGNKLSGKIPDTIGDCLSLEYLDMHDNLFEEYGIGAKASTFGDVYSFGILLLEMFTAKRPTDALFINGGCESLYEYVEAALAEQVMKIVDPLLLAGLESNLGIRQNEELENDGNLVEIQESKDNAVNGTTAPSRRTILLQCMLSVHNCRRATAASSLALEDPNSRISTRIGIPPSRQISELPSKMEERLDKIQTASSTIPTSGCINSMRYLDLSTNALTGEVAKLNLSSCVHLRELYFDHNDLQGNLPTAHLKKLQVLYLGSNSLTGGIPPTFGNLSSLRELGLQWNHLKGRIPHEITRCWNLYFISLGSNNFTGTLSPSFFNMTSIQHFEVFENSLEGTIPSYIGDTMPNLEGFYFDLNQFHGTIPISFSNASKLQILDVSVNYLVGKVPDNIGRLKDLLILDLEINLLGGSNDPLNDLAFITSLSNCSNLNWLSIHENRFEGKLPNTIANLSSKLQYLYLGDNNKIFGTIPKGIQNLVSLISFDIGGNLLSGVLPSEIGELHKLQLLGLYENQLSGKMPLTLFNLTSLALLGLDTNNFDGNIPSNVENFRNLYELYMDENKLDGIIPQQVFNLPSLSKYLDLSNNSFTGPLSPAVGKFKTLNALDISGNKLSGKIPDTIGDCLSLEYLDMHDNLFEEYAIGANASTFGDVYSFGILLLEIFTAKRPTDALFMNGGCESLYDYVEAALTEQVMKIVDPLLVACQESNLGIRQNEVLENDVNLVEIEESKVHNFFFSIFKIGLTCASKSPMDRMHMNEVSRELQKIKKAFFA